MSVYSSCFVYVVLVLMPLTVLAQSCKDVIMASTPDNRFIVDNEKGEVADLKTGLTWKACAEGQVWLAASSNSPASCAGTATIYYWDLALKLQLQQENKWRLPNIKELSSIVEYQCFDPAINTRVFPDTPSWVFGSSSPQRLDGILAVNFETGSDSYLSKGGAQGIRLVRSTQ